MQKHWIVPEKKEVLEKLFELEQACMRRPWTRDMISEHLESPAAITLFINAAGQIVGTPTDAAGYLLGLRTKDADDLLRVAVLPESRGKGFARMLVDVFCSKHRVLLEVAKDNEAALALYRSCGFQKIHTRPAYYQGVDCIVMERAAQA